DRAIHDGKIPAEIDRSKIVVSPPRNAEHGDVANNAPFILAKPLKLSPTKVAELLVPYVRGTSTSTSPTSVVAVGGFINAKFIEEKLLNDLRVILRLGTAYGDCDLGKGQAINVEYVSANPTGPLHVGHGRGAVFGDALASLLEKAGFKVTREYYI